MLQTEGEFRGRTSAQCYKQKVMSDSEEGLQPEMPLMFGKKIGKQKIYISAINGPSLPPKALDNRCRVATPCHSCLGEKVN